MEKISKFFLYIFTSRSILNKKQQKIIYKNLIISPFYGLIEMIGIGLIVVLLINILNPEFLINLKNRFTIFENINYNLSSNKLYFIFVTLIALKYIIQNFIVQYTYKNLRRIHYEVTVEHLKLNIYSKSEYLLQKNIANIVRTIINDTSVIFVDFIRPCIEIFKEICVIFFILFILFIFNGWKVFGILIFFSIILYIITKSASHVGKRISQERFFFQKKFFKNLSEFFLLIKEIRLKNIEEKFLKDRKEEFKKTTDAFSKENIISHQLRFIFEGVFIISILLTIGYYFFYSDLDPETIYSNLFILILPALRLMPAFLRVNGYINKINFNFDIIDSVEKNIDVLKETQINFSSKEFVFKNNIKIKNLDFSYNNKIIFENANIELIKGKSHAIIGTTGIGKSTLVEILMGFKNINSGQVLIDDQEVVDRDISGWRKIFGYVPQDTYLIEDNLLNNIVLTDSVNDKEKNSIIEILKYLKLDDLGDLDNKKDKSILNKDVGSLGRKLSGGQKQRIGLARAMFKDPEIIILDEPTSSLNKIKAQEILNYIINLNKTLIVITHDETLLDKFDIVYKIEEKKIINLKRP